MIIKTEQQKKELLFRLNRAAIYCETVEDFKNVSDFLRINFGFRTHQKEEPAKSCFIKITDFTEYLWGFVYPCYEFFDNGFNIITACNFLSGDFTPRFIEISKDGEWKKRLLISDGRSNLLNVPIIVSDFSEVEQFNGKINRIKVENSIGYLNREIEYNPIDIKIWECELKIEKLKEEIGRLEDIKRNNIR